VSPSSIRASRPVGLVAISVIEFLEAAGVLVVAVRSVLGGPGEFPLTTYGVAGTFIVAAGLLVLVGVGTFRARPWARTSGLVWQVVQFFVGISQTQGPGAPIGLAFALIVPAVVVAVLLFTRPVREAMARSTGQA
jgi:hypothetical protein